MYRYEVLEDLDESYLESSQFSNIGQLDGNNSIADSESSYQSENADITLLNKKGNNTFRVIEANVNSLKGKKGQLAALIESENPDCLILIETKLDSSYKNAEFFDLNTWNIVVREDRNTFGGGIIIAVLSVSSCYTIWRP